MRLASSPSSRRLAWSLVAAAAGAAFTVATFQPGYMSPDSINQLGQARSGLFTAIHPPLMAAVWRPLDALVPGPILMLVLQNLVFWGGAALVVATCVERRWAPWLVLAIGLWPASLSGLSTIWKDIQMGASLVLATGLLLRAGSRRSPTGLAASALCLFYAAAVRHNGLTAVLPLAVWWGILVAPPGARRRAWLGAGLGLALTASIWGAARLVDEALTRGRPLPPPEQSIMIHDVLGITLMTRQLYVPEYLLRQPETRGGAALAALYHPLDLGPIFFDPMNLELTSDPARLATLRSAWLKAITDHPGAYLAKRWAMMAFVLAWNPAYVRYPFHTGVDRNDLGVTLVRSPLNVTVQRLLDALGQSLFFRGWIYLVASVVVILVGLARRRWRWPAVALLASSFAYALPYFFVAPSADFRYLWWCVLATLLLPITLLEPRAPCPSPAP